MRGEHKRLSEIILKKMVEERRRKQLLQDELIDLGKDITSFRNSLEMHAPSYDITMVNTYLERYKDFLHIKMVAGLLNTIESFYIKKKPNTCLNSILSSLQSLTSIELNVPFFSSNFVTLP